MADEVGKAKLEELGIANRVELPSESAPPSPPPNWDDEDYRMDDDEVRTYTVEYQQRLAKTLDIKPEEVRINILNACAFEAEGRYRVRSADIAIRGMTLTLHEKHEARKVLYQMRCGIKPENVLKCR